MCNLALISLGLQDGPPNRSSIPQFRPNSNQQKYEQSLQEEGITANGCTTSHSSNIKAMKQYAVWRLFFKVDLTHNQLENSQVSLDRVFWNL